MNLYIKALHQKIYRLDLQQAIARENGEIGLAHYLEDIIMETMHDLREAQWMEENK